VVINAATNAVDGMTFTLLGSGVLILQPLQPVESMNSRTEPHERFGKCHDHFFMYLKMDLRPSSTSKFQNVRFGFDFIMVKQGRNAPAFFMTSWKKKNYEKFRK